jgi:predicted O-linked N-acetylglucosamine transferase (SPINDLY family)
VPQGIELAFKFHQEGRLNEAERLYREVLRTRPSDFEALHMLGILKLQQGQPEDAVRLIGAALEVDRRSVAAHSNHGLALGALKRHQEALASYDRALAISPRNADALCNRADALCDLGRPIEALASYDQAIAVNPRHVAALVNRGLVLRELGRQADALVSYDKALAADPNDIEAWNNRGVTLHDLGRHAEALTSYERALALAPDYVDALINRGNALLTLRRPDEAIASYTRALVLQPNLADAYNYRGHALADLGHFEEALASYDKAIALKPDHFDALRHRAGVLGKLDRYDQAIAEFDRLRAIKPDLPNLLTDVAYVHAVTCHWPEMAHWAEELTAGVAAGTLAVDPFMFLGFDNTPEQQLACARNWLRHKQVVSVERAWELADFAGGKIRIAYLSADFHRHVTAYVMAELFELHDRDRFEIIGISFGPDDGSAIRSRLIKSFDRFFDVSGRTDAEVAKLLRDLRTHIAVDLKGHTTDARVGILAQRAAPIQVSYMGFPATTGADFIDYVIADRIVLPFDQQPFFAETIVHVPDSYYITDTKRPVAPSIPSRRDAGLPEDGFVFCCFNNSWKINANMFDIWMRLLRAVEGSVLWLLRANEAAVANLRKEAAARGIDPGRLVFATPLDQPDHLARLKLADLLLDTLPYNAHTTATDALWLGVPIVTCLGDVFVGRVAASVLHAVAMPELVTTTLDEYERLALKLATDSALLGAMRQKLVQNGQSCPLFDTDRFRRHIEAAYSTMWETWLRGESPKNIDVTPT